MKVIWSTWLGKHLTSYLLPQMISLMKTIWTWWPLGKKFELKLFTAKDCQHSCVFHPLTCFNCSAILGSSTAIEFESSRLSSQWISNGQRMCFYDSKCRQNISLITLQKHLVMLKEVSSNCHRPYTENPIGNPATNSHTGFKSGSCYCTLSWWKNWSVLTIFALFHRGFKGETTDHLKAKNQHHQRACNRKQVEGREVFSFLDFTVPS